MLKRTQHTMLSRKQSYSIRSIGRSDQIVNKARSEIKKTFSCNIIFDRKGMKYICAMILLCVCVFTDSIFNKKIKFNKSREN